MFGQFVVGPPGSGKTTYCAGMHQFLSAIGRQPIVVNLDPANTDMNYPCTINIAEIVGLEVVMEELQLGPNGGMIYCIEYLEKNLDWLHDKLKAFMTTDYYLLFDCPGQVELFTHHDSIRNILQQLQKWGLRLTVVHLVDSYYCSEPALFISAVFVSLSTMVKLECPHVNVLSKTDLIEKHGELAFEPEFYSELIDLPRLLDAMHHRSNRTSSKRFAKLNARMAEIIEDYSLVSFTMLSVEDKHSMYNVLKVVDKSNGYCLNQLSDSMEASLAAVGTPGGDWQYEQMGQIQEKYVQNWQ
jgi:GTPase SAR1 family protein